MMYFYIEELFLILKKENEDLLRKQDFLQNQQIEKYKQENYKAQCLYEDIKSKLEIQNEKNVFFVIFLERFNEKN